MAQLEVGKKMVRGPTNFWDFSHFCYRALVWLPIRTCKPQWHHCLKKLRTAFFSQICYRVFHYTLTISILFYCTHYTLTVTVDIF